MLGCCKEAPSSSVLFWTESCSALDCAAVLLQDDFIGQSPSPVYADMPYQAAESNSTDKPHLSGIQRLSHVLKGKLGQQLQPSSPGQQACVAGLPREALLPKKPTGLAELRKKLARLSGRPHAKHSEPQSNNAQTGGSSSTAHSAGEIDPGHLAGTDSLAAPKYTPSGAPDCRALACPTAGASGQPKGSSRRCSADREAISQAAPSGSSGRPSLNGKHESGPGKQRSRVAERPPEGRQQTWGVCIRSLLRSLAWLRRLQGIQAGTRDVM